ncbi:MAG: DUF4173 domain-containing protein [Actinobacteria bacterium]|nr:DUF4173 domain-containing protein [Actinomycetota bacterium]
MTSIINNARRFWIFAIFAGWSFDFLFWKQQLGINLAIFSSLCLTAGIALLCLEGVRPARNAILLLPVILFFTTMTFVRMEPLTVFVCVGAALGLTIVLVSTYVGGKWLHYGLVDYLTRTFRLYVSVFTRGMSFIQESRRLREVTGASRGDELWERLWPVIRGVLIAVPIVAVFAALLSSADLVFAQRLGDIASIFSTDKVPEYIFRGMYIIMIAYFLGGIFLHAATRSGDQDVSGKNIWSPFLGFTESSIILGSVVTLFAGFVLVQFQYFFGGDQNIHVAGYTYADYARRGFGELVAVAIFSLLLVLALSAFSRREEKRQKIMFTGLGVAMVSLVLVILVSAFQRIMLYEDAYGFSRLRTYTHVFLVWLGLMLIAVIALEVVRRQKAFALAAVIAAAGFVSTLAVMNVDGFIAHKNVQRAIHGGAELDVQYLESLSDDAVPTLADEYRSAPLSSGLKEQLGLVLRHFADNPEFATGRSWRSYNVSYSRALEAIDESGPELFIGQNNLNH